MSCSSLLLKCSYDDCTWHIRSLNQDQTMLMHARALLAWPGLGLLCGTADLRSPPDDAALGMQHPATFPNLCVDAWTLPGVRSNLSFLD